MELVLGLYILLGKVNDLELVLGLCMLMGRGKMLLSFSSCFIYLFI